MKLKAIHYLAQLHECEEITVETQPALIVTFYKEGRFFRKYFI